MKPNVPLSFTGYDQPDFSMAYSFSQAEINALFNHHKKLRLIYVATGVLQIISAETSLTLHAGELLLNPAEGSTYLFKNGAEGKLLVSGFSETWLNKFQLFLPELLTTDTYQTPLISNLCKRIKHEIRVNDERSPVLIESFFVQLFSYIIRHGITQINKDPDWVASVKNMIDENYQQKLTLADIAKEAGMHPVYLSSQFEKYFSVSFIRYLKAVRIEKSVLLLKQKNKSIAEIAYLCGFADQSHFQRSFKTMFGVSPGYYTHMHQINSNMR